MNALGRLSIRARLYFSMIFSLVLLVVLGGMGYVALDRTRDTVQELFAQRPMGIIGIVGMRGL